jgi:tubulin beta
MNTKISEVVCDENDIGGGQEYCGDNDAQLGRINALYHEVSGGKYVPRAVLKGLEPGVIYAATLSRRLGSFSARETS